MLWTLDVIVLDSFLDKVEAFKKCFSWLKFDFPYLLFRQLNSY